MNSKYKNGSHRKSKSPKNLQMDWANVTTANRRFTLAPPGRQKVNKQSPKENEAFYADTRPHNASKSTQSENHKEWSWPSNIWTRLKKKSKRALELYQCFHNLEREFSDKKKSDKCKQDEKARKLTKRVRGKLQPLALPREKRKFLPCFLFRNQTLPYIIIDETIKSRSFRDIKKLTSLIQDDCNSKKRICSVLE